MLSDVGLFANSWTPNNDVLYLKRSETVGGDRIFCTKCPSSFKALTREIKVIVWLVDDSNACKGIRPVLQKIFMGRTRCPPLATRRDKKLKGGNEKERNIRNGCGGLRLLGGHCGQQVICP